MQKTAKAKEAAEHYGVSIATIRRWARDGSIGTRKTPGGHYQYIIEIEEDDEISTKKEYEGGWSQKVVYLRVGKREGKACLRKQIEEYREKYPKYTIIGDIGSGIDFERQNFKALLDGVFQGNIKKVVVPRRETFVRFGFEHYEWIFNRFGAVLQSLDEQASNEDGFTDLLQIFQEFNTVYEERPIYNKSIKDRD